VGQISINCTTHNPRTNSLPRSELLLHLHPTPGDEHPATTRALSTIVVGVFGTDENAREGYTERERIYRERIYRERIYRERIYRERIYTEREGHTHTHREREREI
jgi:hypothetical protein